MPNHSTIPGRGSVITLGHSRKQPLIRPRSELSDGFEPHGLKQSVRTAACTHVAGHGDQQASGEVYPGWGGWVGTRGAIPGTNPAVPD